MSAHSGCGLDGEVANVTQEAWPALIKPRAGAAAAVSPTAARSPGGLREAELSSSLRFTCSDFPPGVSPQQPERGPTPTPSVRKMSAPAQPPAEGTEGAAPGGGPPGPPPNMTSNRRLQQTQAQVEEVVDIMRVNVDKVLERDQKLSELDDRADALQAGASQFESSAAKLKRKYWWKNCKMMIMLGAICAIIVVVIVIYFFT
ncbi:PREDICTED: vesicle-associated membrane protein 1 [Chinchilla lanigera]|nr:PREDICTED: vesicle-associated membrane protein 1 [Chinchilla lanigera]